MSSAHEKTEPGKGGLTVLVQHNNVDKAIKKLKKMIQNDGILNDIKKHSEYEKPSVIKRRKKAEARRRLQKAMSLRRKVEGF
jgi:small subunit ribosomal protein S21